MAFNFLSMELIYLLFVGSVTKFGYGNESYCYMKDQNPYVYFGTRTAYEHVYGNLSHLPGCGVVFIWGLLRHGTRMGSPNYGLSTRNITRIKNEIIENHEVYKRGQLCDEDLQNLKTWRYNWSDNMNYELTSQGEADMKNLAHRLRATFPSFVSFSKENFTFKTTSKSRCQKSALAFTNGLLNTSVSNLENNNIVTDDGLLRILENKPKGERIPEVKKFRQSKYIEKVLDEVRTRLGYTERLSFDFVKDLYTHCAYENAWVPHSRPGFCAAFTKDHLKILEYADDLEDYYAQGYGTKENAELSCSILDDLLTKIKNAKLCEHSFNKGAFYFAHSETLLPTYTQLGLFLDDEPLRSNNYEILRTKRKWRPSLMDSFASNLLVTLYRCSGKFKIVFYVNEKRLSVTDCGGQSCEIDLFENMITKSVKSCSHSRGSCCGANILLMLFCIYLSLMFYFQIVSHFIGIKIF